MAIFNSYVKLPEGSPNSSFLGGSWGVPGQTRPEVHLRIKVVKHQLVKVVEIPALIQDVFHPW